MGSTSSYRFYFWNFRDFWTDMIRLCTLFWRSRTSWEVFKQTLSGRVPNAGGQLGPFHLFPWFGGKWTQNSKTALFAIRQRVFPEDTGSRNIRFVMFIHPFNQQPIAQPLCQLFIGPEISEESEKQLHTCSKHYWVSAYCLCPCALWWRSQGEWGSPSSSPPDPHRKKTCFPSSLFGLLIVTLDFSRNWAIFSFWPLDRSSCKQIP